MSTSIAPATETPTGTRASASPRPRRDRGWYVRLAALTLGALIFLFPFYYMIVGSLQSSSNSKLSGVLPNPGDLTLANYKSINAAISLGRSLINSGIFTGGVLICTLLFGLLAGYALAQLHFRGRGVVFSSVLLVLVIPFQLLTIPLYVLIVRSYGMADSYLGMILPFAINSTAVFVFRQFFLQLPKDLFDSARIDGASELRVLASIAIPLAKPAILTAIIVTFIGPWNEFLWPFLVTKQQNLQPLAVSLANYISNLAGRATNPYGAILAGAFVLAVPAIALFIAFQKHFVQTDLGSGVKG